jgi:hypothetical protein
MDLHGNSQLAEMADAHQSIATVSFLQSVDPARVFPCITDLKPLYFSRFQQVARYA